MKACSTIVLWNSLGPYHVARLNALARRTELTVSAIELCQSEVLRGWDPPDVALECSRYSLDGGTYEAAEKHYLAHRVLRVLEELAPEALVIAGYSSAPMRKAAQWAQHNRRISVLMSDSQQCDKRRFAVKERLKGWWINRHFDAAFVAGADSAAYLKRLGFPADRVWRGYDVVDNAHFEQGARVVRAEAEQWREKFQLPLNYFLYVGRFAPEKNLERLLQAYALYRAGLTHDPWDLVMVGSGPLEQPLKELVNSRGTKGIHWPGFQQIEVLPAHYGLASCFVLPSVSEPWGLVVNEAMACSLPVLVSERCGAAGDLVSSGTNGFVFDPHDIDGLAALMRRMTSGECDLKAMGEASKKTISGFTPETWASNLTDCIRQTAARKGVVMP